MPQRKKPSPKRRAKCTQANLFELYKIGLDRHRLAIAFKEATGREVPRSLNGLKILAAEYDYPRWGQGDLDADDILAWCVGRAATKKMPAGDGQQSATHVRGPRPKGGRLPATAMDKGGRLSVRELADRHNVNREALDQRLRRWRTKHQSREGWFETGNPKRGEPRYLFDESAVMHIIRDMKPSDHLRKRR